MVSALHTHLPPPPPPAVESTFSICGQCARSPSSPVETQSTEALRPRPWKYLETVPMGPAHAARAGHPQSFPCLVPFPPHPCAPPSPSAVYPARSSRVLGWPGPSQAAEGVAL